MNRDLFFVTGLWIVLTVVGEVLAVTADIYPTVRSDKGEEIEAAFKFLVYLAVPVFSMVVAVLVHGVLTRGTVQFPEEDGPPIRGRGAVPVAWFAITSGLTVFMMIFPGLMGVQKLFFEDEEPELVVQVQSVQWAWIFTYPEQDVQTLNELVLPGDRSVKFEVTSNDVLHSFWIPSFLMKTDAVPGLTTTMVIEPTEIGSFETDDLMRVQCAELCGLSHSRMAAPLTVLEGDEFDKWVAENAEPDGGTGGGGAEAQSVTIVGKDTLFDLEEIKVAAGRPVSVAFDNQDEGVYHNWALYESEDAASEGEEALAGSPLEKGAIKQTIDFDPPEPGTYFFRCDAHPQTMTGQFIVE